MVASDAFAASAGGIEHIVQADPSPTFAARTAGLRLAAEAEALPFAPGSFDAVLSVLALHWTNDLPGALLQLRRALKPDGLLLVSLLGGDTLSELRQSLMAAELAEEGGVSPRVSPFAELRDLGGLLQRAGFAMPVVDNDRLTVTYADALALMRELRGMGERAMPSPSGGAALPGAPPWRGPPPSTASGSVSRTGGFRRISRSSH